MAAEVLADKGDDGGGDGDTHALAGNPFPAGSPLPETPASGCNSAASQLIPARPPAGHFRTEGRDSRDGQRIDFIESIF